MLSETVGYFQGLISLN